MRKVAWLAVVSLCACAGSANAQGYYPGGSYNPGSRPAYSPYLNLLRPDSALVNNYFGLVRPQINFQNSLLQLDAQQALSANQQAAAQENQALPPTGHASRFMTQSRYFLTNGAAGIGTGGGTVGGNAGTQGLQAGTPAQGGRR